MVASPTWPVYVLVFVAACVVNTQSTRVYKNDFVVQMKHGADVSPADVAVRNGFIYKRAITALEGHHHFIHEDLPQHRRKRSIDHIELLQQDPAVERVIQQEGFKRAKRNYKGVKADTKTSTYKVDPNNKYNDELFEKQWYLKNTGQANGKPGLDLNVEDAWRQGFTGKGVVVAIMDDGIDYRHPDIAPNYHAGASYDFSSDDNYPYPRYTEDWFNSHGTRCAGEVSAVANNSVCVVGVAYDSKVAGIRMLDQPYMTDLIESSSMGHEPQLIDIYSASWGPQDDGRTVDGPRELTLKAIANGVNEGRGGLGSIYVWASGDGGAADDCNCDGYASSMWTISINSAINDGRTALYDESCSSTLASTFSNGRNRHPEAGVATTDLYGKCTLQHSGTSAAAPEAAGVFALALEANRNLTWRDMQHLTVLTSKRNQLYDEVHQWRTNGVGLEFNHLFGFGVLDAGSIVREAKNWKAVPERFHCTGASYTEEAEIPSNREGKKLRITLNTDACKGQENDVRYLEHVQGVVTLKSSRRGDVNINMTSPAGTTSILLSSRPNDDDAEEGFEKWPFMTTHNWGEDPSGEWVLEVEMVGGPEHDGVLSEWTLVLHGTQESPEWLDRYMAELELNNGPDVLEDDVVEDNNVDIPDIGDGVPNVGQDETTELENVDDLEDNEGIVEQVDGDDEIIEDDNEQNKIPESVFMEYYDYGGSEYEDSYMTSERYLAQSIYKYLEQENSKGRMDAETAEKIFNKMVEEQVSKDDMEKQLGKAIQYAMNSKYRKPENYGY
ncbi:neuroendocrine convertase 2 [Saccoglossus kowalevskii]|uniref:Neuroendocrine convertase 2 n=1 Tax=Saccoglossus kowalevskii TaxID=10224 RepID=A0ABM0GK19_SACKO|nr:PREDICTED: neuroendocrine convertase 2 [Saccoglossus kowalevskii]